jgi:hypothetical protein
MLHHVVPGGTSIVSAIPSQASDINAGNPGASVSTGTIVSAGTSTSAAGISAAAAAAAQLVSQAEMWSRFTSSSFQTVSSGNQYSANGINVPQFTPQSLKGEQVPQQMPARESVHTAEMSCQAESGQFLCGVCGTSFMKNSDLKQHIKSHADDFPHGCRDCGAHFSSAHSLQRHQKTHTQVRPWKCTYLGCDSAFAHKGALVNHERIHTGTL